MKKQEDKLITKPQIKKVWVAAKELGLTKEDVYKCIEMLSGKDSMRAMTKDEAKTLIDLLTGEYNKDKEEHMATDRQIYKIYEYSNELNWSVKALMKFIRKYAHVDHINWLDKKAASNIIEGLKNISARQNQPKKTNTRG
ncbi:MAG: DUF1018 domain-containing protein [Clostridiaceae bacterium]|nr:DUF1018 domain-containing protein [Clostridiaceae bacterium]